MEHTSSRGLVAIILPVYNMKDYLDKCLDSVLEQSYRDLDVIAVNDGSTDGSLAILEERASKDPRLRVITQSNGGLSAARNKALASLLPQTEFITFVDSDDWLPNDAIQNMVNCLYERQADMVCGLYDSIWHNGSGCLTSSKVFFSNENVISKEQMFDLLVNHLKPKYIFAWGKMYKKEILNSFQFPVGKYFEDSICHRIYGKCKRIAFLNEVVYHYLKRPGSITHSGYDIRWLDSVEMLVDRIKYLREEGFNDYSTSCLKKTYVWMREILFKIPRLDTTICEQVKYLRKLLAIEYKKTSFEGVPFKERVSLWANNHLFWLLYYRWKLHYRHIRAVK